MYEHTEAPASLHELIRNRWSPRAYSDRPLTREQIRTLLEAARWAPSSSNEQPWSYLIATKEDPAEFERLASCLVEGNAIWAKRAPVLLLAVASTRFARTAKPNSHGSHDVGLANENLVLQAVASGLVAHQMAGFLPDRARELYEIPEGQEPLTMIAVGFPGDPAELTDVLRQREAKPRDRKPLADMVFSGKWGKTADL